MSKPATNPNEAHRLLRAAREAERGGRSNRRVSRLLRAAKRRAVK
jgi:predicted DsbA family dithiol-disulfide isomerase